MKSCPFCGSTALGNLAAAEYSTSPVMCNTCGAHGPCRNFARLTVINNPPTNGYQAWAVRHDTSKRLHKPIR